MHFSVSIVLIFAIHLAAAAEPYQYKYVDDDMRQLAKTIRDAAMNPANRTDVYDRLGVLTDDFGPRLSGSENLENALDWVVAEASKEAHLYKTTVEPVMVPAWVRGKEYAILRLPKRNKDLHMVGLGMSNGTGGSILSGDVMVVRSHDELLAKSAEAKGKIVVFNVPFTTYGQTVQYRGNGAKWVAEVGGIACIIRSVASYSMQSPHTGTSTTWTIPAAAVSIEDATQMQRLYDRGVPMKISLYMEAHQLEDKPSRNILFDLEGSEKPNEFVVFGGHSDSWDIAEGAMDDGGGIISAWHAIRMLAILGLRSKRTLRAVMWVNEENGSRGAEAYAAAHADEFNRTSFALETDEGAFSPWAIGFSGKEAAYNQMLLLAELVAPLGAGNVTRGGGGEDISPMCQQGVPCAGLTPRDPRATNYSNNPCRGMLSSADYANKALGSQHGIPDGYFWFHHSAPDTLDRMDPEQLQAVSATLAIWAISVGNLPALLPRDDFVPPLSTAAPMVPMTTQIPPSSNSSGNPSPAAPPAHYVFYMFALGSFCVMCLAGVVFVLLWRGKKARRFGQSGSEEAAPIHQEEAGGGGGRENSSSSVKRDAADTV